MECHQVHVAIHGAFQELAAGDQGAVGCQIEAILPAGLFQVQRVDGGIAEVEQLLTFGGDEHGEVARRVSGCGNGDYARHDFGFAIDGFDLVAEGAEAAAGHGI